MGKIGESYLVGSNYLMRSDSFLDPINHSVKASFANPELGSKDSKAVKAALIGAAGIEKIIDYKGNPALSAFTPINVYGNR